MIGIAAGGAGMSVTASAGILTGTGSITVSSATSEYIRVSVS